MTDAVKRKIVLIANNYWNFYNFRRELIQSLSEYEVILVGKFDGYEKHFDSYSCEHVQFKNHSWSFSQNLKSLVQTALAIKRIRPDYILTFTIKPNLYTAITGVFQSFIHISNITGFGSILSQTGYRKFIINYISSFILNHSDYIFVQNTDDYNYCQDLVNSDRLQIVPGSGVDTGNIKMQVKLDHKQLKVIFIGRLLNSKGVPTFVKTACELCNVSDNYEFTIFGKLDLEHPDTISTELLTFIESSSCINLELNVDNVSERLFGYDVAVLLTNYSEGTPRSLIEAMASKNIVLTTDVPGCRDLHQYENGVFLIEGKNLTDELKYLQQLDLIDFQRLQNENRLFISERYDVANIVNAYKNKIRGDYHAQ
ncbi:glycosyltransferase [Amylibacter sp.]|nr:glycosyltransferase [Amylibacter sp.]